MRISTKSNRDWNVLQCRNSHHVPKLKMQFSFSFFTFLFHFLFLFCSFFFSLHLPVRVSGQRKCCWQAMDTVFFVGCVFETARRSSIYASIIKGNTIFRYIFEYIPSCAVLGDTFFFYFELSLRLSVWSQNLHENNVKRFSNFFFRIYCYLKRNFSVCIITSCYIKSNIFFKPTPKIKTNF